MDDERHNPSASHIMIVAIFIMFTTLRPILIPPPHLLINATNPKPGTTEAEFRVVIHVAIKSFWLFSNLAFALALAAALVQAGKSASHGSSVSLILVMVALLCMWLSTNCALVVNLSHFLHCFPASPSLMKHCFFC